MTERPILFSSPMVRALLAGTKTQTRRVLKWQPTEEPSVYQPSLTRSGSRPVTAAVWGDSCCICPFGVPGDRLWVRETWMTGADSGAFYRADGHEAIGFRTWSPSIFMPRWASRITLEITGVRVQRVQDIGELDAVAEGIYNGEYDPGIGKGGKPGWCWSPGHFAGSPRHAYELLWDTLNAKRGHGWATNPWVWVVEFRKVP